MSSQPTTPRRSKRGQPLVLVSKNAGAVTGLGWTTIPVHSRIANPELDFAQEDTETYTNNPETVHEDTSDEDEEAEELPQPPQLEAHFYNAFQRAPKAQTYRGRKKGAAAKPKSVPLANEVFNVGDTVLIKSFLGPKGMSVGAIVAMWQLNPTGEVQATADENMRIRIHWFLRPNELANVRAKRETQTNEIYLSASKTTVLRPSSVHSLCTVSAEPLSDDDDDTDDNRFYCHQVVDPGRGAFFELDWAKHRERAMYLAVGSDWGALEPWRAIIDLGRSKTTTKAKAGKTKSKSKTTTKKPQLKVINEDAELSDDPLSSSGSDAGNDDSYEGPDSDEDSDAHDLPVGVPSDDEAGQEEDATNDSDDTDTMPQTPSRKRKRGTTTATTTTPRKPKRARTIIQPTPRSKARASTKSTPKSKSKGKTRKLPMPLVTPSFTSTFTLFQGQDKQVLEDHWLRAMHVLHVGSRPDTLPCRDEEYGKIMRSVQDLLEDGNGGCVYISGVPGTGKTATVHAVIRDLKQMAQDNETNPFTFVEINGLRIPEPSAAYTHLWSALSGQENTDKRISANESLKSLNRYFSGSSGRGPGEHACVVLMDELDQLVTTKQDVVYNFFNWPMSGNKLIVLAVANTMDLPERVLSGRVRSRLGMTRINFQPYKRQQLIEIVQSRLKAAKDGLELDGDDKDWVIKDDAVNLAATKVSAISGDARRVLDICRRAVEVGHATKSVAKTADVSGVIKSMQNSPTAAYLRDCSYHERVMLASLIKCIKREGVDEIKWSEIQYQHLTYTKVLPSSSADHANHKLSPNELNMVLDSLCASHAISMEMPGRKSPGERKVILNLEQGEVERVLSDVGGHVWNSALG